MQDGLPPVNVLHARLTMMDASSDVSTWRTRMATVQRPNRINVDLQDYKQVWLDYCKAHSITPSAAFRQIVAKLTGGGAPADLPVEERSVRRKCGLNCT